MEQRLVKKKNAVIIKKKERAIYYELLAPLVSCWLFWVLEHALLVVSRLVY